VPAVDVKLEMAADGQPLNATAVSRVDSSIDRVWKVIADVEGYSDRIPMISKVRLDGRRATVHLKFKVSLFSVGFDFVVDVTSEEKKFLELRYVSGEPRGIKLRFDLEPLDGGAATELKAYGAFDPMSLGWLAKYFLRHHPEIQNGIIPGVAIGLLESMRKAAR
jgi:hypothetical protein